MKFVPQRERPIKGFWVPEEGEVLAGVLEEIVPGDPRPFYVVRVEEPSDAVTVKTRDNGVVREVEIGDRVGVSSYLELRGLEKYVQHHMRIRSMGDRQARTGRAMRTFDVDISEAPIADEPDDLGNSAAHDGDALRKDDGVPF